MDRTTLRKFSSTGIVVVGVVGLLAWVVQRTCFPWVDTNFATKASLHYHYNEKAFDAVITDADDVRALKRILGGFAVPADHALYFTTDGVAITLTDGRRSVTFYPALGGERQIDVEHVSGCRSLSHEQYEALKRIMRKYGLILPI